MYVLLVVLTTYLLGKVSKLYPPTEGSLAGWPPVRFEPRTHRLRGWIVDFPLQVPRRLLEYPEQRLVVNSTYRLSNLH